MYGNKYIGITRKKRCLMKYMLKNGNRRLDKTKGKEKTDQIQNSRYARRASHGPACKL